MNTFIKGLIVGAGTVAGAIAIMLAFTPPVEQMIYEYIRDINE